jgi:hypothetical protein
MHHATTHNGDVVGVNAPSAIQQDDAHVRSGPALGAIEVFGLDMPTDIVIDGN